MNEQPQRVLGRVAVCAVLLCTNWRITRPRRSWDEINVHSIQFGLIWRGWR